jgi:hypothetical protein
MGRPALPGRWHNISHIGAISPESASKESVSWLELIGSIPNKSESWGVALEVFDFKQNRHPERSASQICRVTRSLLAESKDPGGAYSANAARSFQTLKTAPVGPALVGG